MSSLEKEKIYQIYYDAALLYAREIFNENRNGIKYLENRGFNKSIIDRFMIGFSPKNENRDFIISNLTNKYSINELIESKIVSIDLKNRSIVDYFGSQRVIFPVFENGKVVTFSTRSIYRDVNPKYKTLCLPNSRLGIFNFDSLNKNIKKLYLCEGVIDSLTLIKHGFNSIGILGINAINTSSVRDIVKTGFCGRIILVLDNDKNLSGQNSITRLGNLLFCNGLTNLSYKTLPREESENKMDISSYSDKFNHTDFVFNFLDIEENEYYPDFKSILNMNNKPSRRMDNTEFSIVDTISDYISLPISSGNRIYTNCPFPEHDDKNASFVIYLDTQSFMCFGCRKAGDSIKFIMMYENLPYKEALNKLLINKF